MRSAVRSTLSTALLGAALVAGCATQPVTTVEVTWAAPQLPPPASYKKLLIITVAASETVQAGNVEPEPTNDDTVTAGPAFSDEAK